MFNGTDPTPMSNGIAQSNRQLEYGISIARHLFLKEIKNGGNNNLVLSPVSLHAMLGMLASGAQGHTLEQLLSFLGFENISDLNAESSKIMALATTASPEFLESETTSNTNSKTSSCNVPPPRPFPYSCYQSLGSPYPRFHYDISGHVDFPHPISSYPISDPLDFPFMPSDRPKDSPFPIFDPLDCPFMPRDRPKDYPFPIFDSLGFDRPKDSPFPILDPLDFPFMPRDRPKDSPFTISDPLDFPFMPSNRPEDSPIPSASTNASNLGPIITFAIGIWVDHRYPIKYSFEQLAEDVYKAKAESVDFENQADQVREEVNSWAEKASKGLIDELLPSGFLNPESVLVLANSLYFKGTWLEPFRESDTGNEDFHLLNGTTVRVLFMKSYTLMPQSYASFESFKLLKLPFKSGTDDEKFSLYIFLPHKKDGLQELLQQLDSHSRLLHEHWELQKVALCKIWIPRLKFSYNLVASDIMKELGLDSIFELNNRELRGISDSPYLHVSGAIQKSYIEVNEEGTIATSDGFHFVTAAPTESFVADHPFMFMIKEEISGITLFTGAVLDPR